MRKRIHIHMRTTLDIPDELFRALKVRAASEDKTLKVLLSEIIADSILATRQPSNIRTVKFSGTIHGPGGPAMKSLTNEKIEDLLSES
jgi:hypothetical protein